MGRNRQEEPDETVTDSDEAAGALRDALRENLSPEAVAAIAAHLHGAVRTNDEEVNKEVAWFTELLLAMVGDQYNDLCEEVGL